ncbi:MAG: PepSY-associated TM helix domain-containing protein, partial [Sphingomonadaceae bacterium]|nr:PepSY-associated TM helix domain-containing protein [Sphingomonadaceae bacterium]
MSKQAKAKRSFWLKQLHTWHWVSSAVCLIGMLLFAITGITLNHAGAIEADPVVSERNAALPAPLLATLNATKGDKADLPPAV